MLKMAAFAASLRQQYGQAELSILDLGSQDVNGSYKELFTKPGWHYLGLDMAPGKNVDLVLADPYNWTEIPSASVDIVISGQAFEHIEFIWLTIQEIARVLKPGGQTCILAPSAGGEHKYPVDCWRIYPDGMRALAKYAGLTVVSAVTDWADAGEWKNTMLVASK